MLPVEPLPVSTFFVSCVVVPVLFAAELVVPLDVLRPDPPPPPDPPDPPLAATKFW